jgi:hypothetical protein
MTGLDCKCLSQVWSRPCARPGGARAGPKIEDLTGVAYDPLGAHFRLSRDPAVSYTLFASRD